MYFILYTTQPYNMSLYIITYYNLNVYNKNMVIHFKTYKIYSSYKLTGIILI